MDEAYRVSQESNEPPTQTMRHKGPKGGTKREIKKSAGKKRRRPPNPAPPEGHCWDFWGGSCSRGAKCIFKHDEVVKNAFMERIPLIIPPKEPGKYTQAAPDNKFIVKKSNITPARTPRLETLSNRHPGQYYTPPANLEVSEPKRNQKCSNRKSKNQKCNTQKLDNQKFSNPKRGNQIWRNQKTNSQSLNNQTFSNQKLKSADSTPPSSPKWGACDAGWNVKPAEVALWNTAAHLEADDVSWATNQAYGPAGDITTRVFSKIYAEAVKFPHLTTKTRRSRSNKDQPFFEIAQAALVFAQKRDIIGGSDVLNPDTNADRSILVRAAEGYVKALKAGKMPDVLKRREQAHLDVIVASQYWNDGLSITERLSTTSVSNISSSITRASDAPIDTQQSSTKTWEQSDYWAWAKRNLTDATAIKLARTYCQSLENGMRPRKLFSSMGKQAPSGTAFHYFSLLPYEIRELIWLYVLSIEKNDVRLVWIYETGDNDHLTNTSFVNANQQQRLLLVNHELRDLALKHNYELVFGTKHSRAQTYFDFSRDRLFLHTRHSNELPALVKYLHPRERDRVVILAVSLRDFVNGDEHRNAEALCKFRNVKKIHLVCGDGLEDRTYAGAGDRGLAKAIQRLLYDTWRRNDEPSSWPKVRMYTIPALTAKYFGIDNVVNSIMYS